MKNLRHCLNLAATAAVLATSVHPALAVEPLVSIGDVLLLSREQVLKSLPLHVRGVVTWRDQRGQLVLQDDTGGCWIYVDEARNQQHVAFDDATLNSIRVGNVVEVEGTSDPGSYAPGILPKTIRVVGEGALPMARPMDPARFFSGAETGLRIEVHGVVQNFQPSELGWLLELNANPGRFVVEISKNALPDPAAIVDAEVKVTGVAVTRVNTRGEITMPRVFSDQPDDLVVEVPAIAPFAAPLVPLDRLLPFRPDPRGPHRLRVIGIVTYSLTGKFLYLQEGTSAVQVETHSLEQFQAGDRVEAAGFVDMTRHVGALSEALVRKIGRADVPSVVDISPEEIIAVNHAAITSAQLAQPYDFDGHLIRFRASLLALQSSPDPKQPWRRLTLKRGEMIIGAILHEGDAQAMDALQPGSELVVTGIVQLEYTPVAGTRLSLMPTRLDVVLRSATDIGLVREPSWWTARRLLGVVASVVFALCIALVWVGQLRRQVHRKTQLLATEMRARRDAAVEFQATLRERNRLAANLHDTLLQTLGGIGFQIGATEAEAALPGRDGKPLVHLAVTRRILDHAVRELRSSVWALRSLPLEGKGLPEALRSLVERAEAGQHVRIELRTAGDLSRVSDFVAGNLVLAAQEALHNALKHGAPNLIIVEARPAEDANRIVLVVRDDGAGFTPGQVAGATQGHFGLMGMRERIERLDGTLVIQSAPGMGTLIQFEVPLRSYDETLT